MFGCLFLIFRSVASLILGLVIFFGFLAYLLVSNFHDNFLSLEFYTDSLSENSVYDRFYDEVLLDPEFKETRDDLLGDLDFTRAEEDIGVTDRDIIEVSKEILSPAYLQSQVEWAVKGAIDYLNKETDTPELFIDLGPPLGRAKPVLFRYIDKRIDELQGVPVNTMEELQSELESLYRTVESGKIPTQLPSIADPEILVTSYVDGVVADLEVVPAPTLQDFSRELENVYAEVAKGRLPTTVPSVDAIPVQLRSTAYDTAFTAFRNNQSIPQEVRDLAAEGLGREEVKIKAQLERGDVKAAIREGTAALTGPVVEKFIDDGFDLAFDQLKKDPNFPKLALQGLQERADDIKKPLGQGKIKEALKVGARAVATPLIDEALDEIRKELDGQDRLDLVAKGAEQNNQTKEEFLDDLDLFRDVIDTSALGGLLAIVIIVVAVILMAAVHLPHLSSGLRWPGITLLLSGLVFLIVGLVLDSRLSDRANDLLDREATGSSPIPPALIDIISDVLTSMVSDVGSGFVTPAIVIMVIGLAMLISSFLVRLLHIPFLSR